MTPMPTGRPFVPAFPIRGLDDVRRLESVPLAEAVPARSTHALFVNSAAAFGERTAITFLRTADDPQPVTLSYAALLDGVHRMANALHALGLQPQQAVSVLLPACPQYHLALWGGEAAGIVQPLNPLLSLDKLASLMNAAGSRVLVAWGADDEAGYWCKALALRERVPTLHTVLRVAPPGEAPGSAPRPDGVLDLDDALRAQPGDRLVGGRVIDPEDTAALFHTGGTTGAPKLARHSHRAQVFTAWACVQMQGLRAGDVSLNGYPLFHVAGVLAAALPSFAAGVQVVIPTPTLMRNREVLRGWWRLVERFRPTALSAVPTVLAALTEVPLDGADISSIRYCRTGAAPLSPELAARFERLFGLHVHESLGMTEMAGISTITPPGVVGPAGCVGWRLPYSRLRIVALDANGGAGDRDLPPGETGVVLFRSPNLFSGFVDEADNARAFTADGWLVTGDMGWLDDEGRLHLTGRAKDLIIRSGHNIDPKVIEDALESHPAVNLAAAVGAPDAYAGEVPVAFVTLQPGAEVDEATLLAHVAARVDEGPARPKRVTVLPALPVTQVGKIFKPALRQQAALATVRDRLATLWQAEAPTTAPPPEVDADGPDGLLVRLAADLEPRLAEAVADAVARLGVRHRIVTD
ncbi:acyl-CoA synthetase [Aquabacterium sp. J223]|uniref:acyl-CoA synthetase n=1 Tax=Aquabacterium sp. J223 TaxID=2898431 RepID=UPI0021ADFFFB|nr:acyl-CoA synthetase [Aquabacterium sp. J223]UUX95603.1 acyl-CoA synthetase [Aquabacterium sp. J223]